MTITGVTKASVVKGENMDNHGAFGVFFTYKKCEDCDLTGRTGVFVGRCTKKNDLVKHYQCNDCRDEEKYGYSSGVTTPGESCNIM